MKITAIKQQIKTSNRYSVFVEGTYAFSLSESALIEAKITSGQELGPDQIESYKRLSADDKLYNRALRYVALRPRSIWEVSDYLQRKQASPQLTDGVIEKLSGLGLLDDYKYARAFVHDRRLLRSNSKRKLIAELRKRRVQSDAITQALADDETNDLQAIRELIVRKRRQTKYHDDNKLMQLLARQGFNYGDIKTALGQEVEEA